MKLALIIIGALVLVSAILLFFLGVVGFHYTEAMDNTESNHVTYNQ